MNTNDQDRYVTVQDVILVGAVIVIFFIPFVMNFVFPDSELVMALFRNYRALVFYAVAYGILILVGRTMDRSSRMKKSFLTKRLGRK